MEDLVTAADIKRIRRRYGLSQKSFAQVLGIGDASIVRYENGSKPTRAISNLIRAAENEAFMLACLARDGGRIPLKQKQQAEEIIYSEVTFNEKGEVMGMDEIYRITLQQEILNEQAAGMLADLARMEWAAEDAGNEMLAAVYSDIAKQLSRAKRSIVSSEFCTETGVAVVRARIESIMQVALSINAMAA